jgi:hypothetical protein
MSNDQIEILLWALLGRDVSIQSKPIPEEPDRIVGAGGIVIGVDRVEEFGCDLVVWYTDYGYSFGVVESGLEIEISNHTPQISGLRSKRVPRVCREKTEASR